MFFRFLLFLLLYGQCQFVFGNDKVDSLKSILEKSEVPDSSRISTCLEISLLLDETDEDQLNYALEALIISEKLESPYYFIKSSESVTSIYYFKGDYEKAKEIISKAVDVARVNKMWPELGSSLITLGQIEDYLEDDKNALSHTLEGISLHEETENYEELIRGYNSLGGYYYYREMNDKALEYYHMAQAMMANHLDLASNYEIIAVTESNIGWVYYYQGKIEDAIVQIRNAIKIYDKFDGNSSYGANARSSLSIMYSEIGMFIPAIQEAKKSIETSLELNYIKGLYNGYEALGSAYSGKGEVNNAIEAFEMAYAYADSLGFLEDMAYSALRISEIYGSYNEFEDAYSYLLLNKELEDSLNAIRIDESFNEAITKYETEKSEAQIKLLKQDNKLKHLELENQKIASDSKLERQWIIGSSIGIVLLISLSFFIYQNRIKQRTNNELHKANDIIQEKNNDITASIEYASKIQEALLPTKESEDLFNDSFFILMPKDIVSGDFLWYSKVGNKVVFTAADCTGHGVPGAFMSMIGNTFLHQIVNERRILQPSDILDELRERVITALSQQGAENARKDGMDMAMCVLDLDSMMLEYAGANNPLYFIQSNQMKEIKPDKQPVGYMPERPDKFTNHKIQLSKGDAVYIFSDGYADQFGGPKGKKFKYKQLRELLLANKDLKMNLQKEKLLSSFKDWKGDLEQIDDVCLLGVRV